MLAQERDYRAFPLPSSAVWAARDGTADSRTHGIDPKGKCSHPPAAVISVLSNAELTSAGGRALLRLPWGEFPLSHPSDPSYSPSPPPAWPGVPCPQSRPKSTCGKGGVMAAAGTARTREKPRALRACKALLQLSPLPLPQLPADVWRDSQLIPLHQGLVMSAALPPGGSEPRAAQAMPPAPAPGKHPGLTLLPFPQLIPGCWRHPDPHPAGKC